MRSIRLRHFEERLSWDRSAFTSVLGLGGYIAVHPFSDESELLEKLGISPEQCLAVDCYWNTGDDIHFVQVQGSGYASTAVGIYARSENGDVYKTNIVAVTSAPMIARGVLENSLALSEALLRSDPVLPRGLQRLG